MHDEQNDHNPALAELRERLVDGLAQARLTQKQLVARTGLGRTTVSEALSSKGPVPSARTVGELARVLKLPGEELLALRRDAAGEVQHESGERSGPGRPIGEWDPHDLEVHPAGPGPTVPVSDRFDGSAARVLPTYVPREHDRVLTAAVRDVAAGRSRIVVLVGDSSTGKTRACWEAVQPLADLGWQLWHPFDPTRSEAALEDLQRVGPRTVVWLNEAQHYLGDRTTGERIAAAVHHLLVDPKRAPVLVLGTLWREYAAQYTAMPSLGGEDPHSRVRELLAGHTQAVPDAFDADALTAAAVLAEGGDQLLGDALTRAGTDGRVPQDLAGAPELLNRYQHATPAAKALVEAAMDARRLGIGPHLPQSFLTTAAPDYLSQNDYDQLTDDWAERAYAELAKPVHGKQAPLRRTTPRPSRRPSVPSILVDTAASPSAGPVFRLADYLEQHGRTARQNVCPPASFWHAAHTHLTDPDELNNLTQAAQDRYRLQWAYHLSYRAADHGDPHALVHLARMREDAGDREIAETLYRQAADHGDPGALFRLADMRQEAGDREDAETLYRQAADRGHTHSLVHLAEMRQEDGNQEGAEALFRQAADHGDPHALVRLAEMKEEAGDREDAEALARQAADHGASHTLVRLAKMRGESGDRESAEDLLRQAADHGEPAALVRLAEMKEEAGDQESAETLARQAADQGDPHALVRLAEMREEAGDQESAETLARQAADQGQPVTLIPLAEMHRLLSRLWPYGLDPDGTPTPPWQPLMPAPLDRPAPPPAS
ncbi:tetratricopeptide repeat protein [Streptomyces sp. NPDC055056]